MDQKLIDSLNAVRDALKDESRPENVERVHATGKLTARERLSELLDPDSVVQYGAITAQTKDGEWVPEGGGVDVVGSIDGQVVVSSSTDFTDHGGGYGAGRLSRLFSLAVENRWPLVVFVDGGGTRARHPRTGRGDVEITGPMGRFSAFEGMAELSGWAPTIAIVSGPSFAGHATIAGFSDFLIATAGSSIGIGGPPMVEAALGARLTPHQLSPAEGQETGGGIDLLVEDERAAIVAARKYLSYYRDLDSGEAAAGAEDIATLLPSEGPYDVREVIRALVDDESTFELRPNFAMSLVTMLARVNGRTVGVMANQPLVRDGVIDENAATKISRFIEQCDAYEYPILSLVDTPGCVSTWKEGKGEEATVEPGITRWHTRPLIAHQHRTVPLFGVVLRRGRGLGKSIMTGFATSRGMPALVLGWPTTEIGRVDGFSAAYDQNALDDVVTPVETRERIARMLGHFERKLERDEKKHTIDTW